MDKIYYLYEDHLRGGVYWCVQELSLDDLYCERCGDQDEYIDYFSNELELEKILEESYEEDYIKRTISSFKEEVGHEK